MKINNYVNLKKVAIIILNYNGWCDTIGCLKSLHKIDYPDYLMVVVDNGSSDGSIEKIKSWAEGNVKVIEYEKEIAEQGGVKELEGELERYSNDKKIVLIKNNANLGYSAGNNVGIRYVIKKGADTVLIVNPDVRIEEPQTIRKMVDAIFSGDDIFIVGPNIIDIDGNSQNPLVEPTFFKECLNPFFSALRKKLQGEHFDYVELIKSDQPHEVKKVSGACLMIKTSFLKEIGLLDESVFLYCEEPILMYKVHKCNGKIIYLPTVFARHLHQAEADNTFKYRLFIKSRVYFLSKYKRYGFLKIVVIKVSYSLVLFVKMLRSFGKRSSLIP